MEDKQKTERSVEEFVENIVEELDSVENNSKPWYLSRIIIINIGLIVIYILGILGINIYDLGWDEQRLNMLASLIIPIINIYLRIDTKKSIKRIRK